MGINAVNCAQLSGEICANVMFFPKLLICTEYQMVWAMSLYCGLDCCYVFTRFAAQKKPTVEYGPVNVDGS